GCGILSDTFVVMHDNPIQFKLLDLIKPSCEGLSDGMILIDQTGGIEPYSYIWSTGDTIQNPENLAPGTYKVTITDSSGCRVQSPDIQLDPEKVFNIGIIQKIEPSCYDANNGKISLFVTGGNPPYRYNWNNGDTSSVINDLFSGDYYCTITDSELCSKVFGPVTLNEPDSLTSSIIALDNVTCIGEENGLIEIKTNGGTPPYSFIWQNYSGNYINFNDDIYNLKAGMYKVRIIDSKGCQKILDSIRINTIDNIALKIDSIRHVNCSGTVDGYIKASAYNGYGQYYYFWNTGDNLIDHIDSLPAGVYGITATDDLGCKQILNNIEVKNLNIPLQVNIRQIDSILCYGDKTASVEANVVSGNSPFDFNWNAGIKNINNSPVDTLNNIGVGDYNITVTDSKGCIGSSNSITIEQPPALEVADVEVDEILCYNENTGKIYLEIQGGTPEYKVFWNDTTKTGNEIIKLKSGIYQATIIDNNNCQLVTNDIVLDQPGELKVTIISNPAHKNMSDGSAKILVEGGVSPYFFEWDENAGNQTGNEAVNLASGWYDVSLTDYNDCFKLVKVFISESVGTDENYADKISVYPNPAKNLLYIFSSDLDDAKLALISITGIEKELSHTFVSENTIKADVYDFTSGTYILKIRSGENIYFKKIVILK
ncbi:MAG TPA: T9SS type A sorting domain-containing protein, partial [Bacteroidetes bacterium]|nr:T9SS type A sorting domain-containing protein [Bacteroidota bacterium]